MADYGTPTGIAKPEVKEGDLVHVCCGAGPGVQAHLTRPFDAIVREIRGEDAHVIRVERDNKRKVKVPKGACTAGHTKSESAPRPPRFNEMTPAAKSQVRKAACREMAMEVKLLKRKQRTVVLFGETGLDKNAPAG